MEGVKTRWWNEEDGKHYVHFRIPIEYEGKVRNFSGDLQRTHTIEVVMANAKL